MATDLLQLLRPFEGSYPSTQGFGERPEVYGQWGLDGHNGLDWGIPTGVPIRAPIGGESRIYWDPGGYGENVEIYFEHGYAILAHGVRGSTVVRNGQMVEPGDVLFLNDSTGFSSGPHVHFGLKLYGNEDNGYRGWVDPAPYIVDELSTEHFPMDQPKIRIGQHNWEDRTGHSPGTPFMEVAYAFDATDGLDFFESGQRVKMLADNGHRPLLRLDFKPGQTCPGDEQELVDFLGMIDALFAQIPALDGIDITAFNEPNFDKEGAFNAAWVARCFNGYDTQEPPYEAHFVSKIHGRGPACRIWAPAGLAFGSHVDGSSGGPPGGESSIWSRWYYDFLVRTKEAFDESWSRQFYGFLLHAYARPEFVGDPDDRHHEPWHDIRSADGARFGTNVVDTWEECLQASGFGGHPVWISEYNSGANTASRANYAEGLLLHARDRMIATFGDRLEALTWFVGRHDGVWQKSSLEDPQGAMVDADADYRAIVRMGG